MCTKEENGLELHLIVQILYCIGAALHECVQGESHKNCFNLHLTKTFVVKTSYPCNCPACYICDCSMSLLSKYIYHTTNLQLPPIELHFVPLYIYILDIYTWVYILWFGYLIYTMVVW